MKTLNVILFLLISPAHADPIAINGLCYGNCYRSLGITVIQDPVNERIKPLVWRREERGPSLDPPTNSGYWISQQEWAEIEAELNIYE